MGDDEGTQHSAPRTKRKQQAAEEPAQDNNLLVVKRVPPEHSKQLRCLQKKKKKAKKGHTALPWIRMPAAFPPSKPVRVSDVAGMHARLTEALQSTGHSTLFPVQAVAWQVLAGGMSGRHDLCIDAPTGSGKTLAYALPVLQRCLCKPVGAGIQALVVVPTRALAKQVFDVFRSLQEHLPPMHLVLANGSTSVTSELAQLAGCRASSTSAGSFENIPRAKPSAASHKASHAVASTPPKIKAAKKKEANLNNDEDHSIPAHTDQQLVSASLFDLLPLHRKCFGHPHRNCTNVEQLLESCVAQCMEQEASADTAALCVHGSSMWQWGDLQPQVVSVAVVTPGRLVQHLQELGHSWLANLELLVVDEADRLLRQAYNEWLPVLNDALAKNSQHVGWLQQGGAGVAGALRGQYAALLRSMPSTKRLVKVLVSATLTKDPTKLAKMDLKFPRFISVDTPPPAVAFASTHDAPIIDHGASPPPPAADETAIRKKKKETRIELETCLKQSLKRANTAITTAVSVSGVCNDVTPPSHPVHARSPSEHSAHSTGQHASGELQTTMHEYQVVTAAHTKPHALLALLGELQGGGGAVRAIVFASAVDAARRLRNLLEGSGEVLGLRVFEMSSRVASRVQVETFAALQREPSWVLVASDNMTRGMDFPRVHTVINYDLPAHIRTYVHRAGRTARAGTSGSVYTILRSEHLGAFSAMMRRGGRTGILTHKISPEAWNGMKDAVHAALEYVQQQEAAA